MVLSGKSASSNLPPSPGLERLRKVTPVEYSFATNPNRSGANSKEHWHLLPSWKQERRNQGPTASAWQIARQKRRHGYGLPDPKQFVHAKPEEQMEIRQLSQADADQIVALERRSFIPSLQANIETVLQRFSYGHFMFGVTNADGLQGLVCFSYGQFDPKDRKSMPATLKELCCQAPFTTPNAAYIYNLELAPEYRGLGHYRTLLRAAMDRAKGDGLTYAVGNGRVPSYAGSEAGSRSEHVEQNAAVRMAIDRFLAGGPHPSQDELMNDPLLSIYRRLLGGEFLWVIPEFAPDDRASGGVRVIGYRELSTWS